MVIVTSIEDTSSRIFLLANERVHLFYCCAASVWSWTLHYFWLKLHTL